MLKSRLMIYYHGSLKMWQMTIQEAKYMTF